MNKTIQIAILDLRVFLKNKTSLFWLFGAPLMFTVFTGILTEGKGDKPNRQQDPLVWVISNDEGKLSKSFVNTFEKNGLRIAKSPSWNDADAHLTIPQKFSENILNSRQSKLDLKLKPGVGGRWEILLNGRLNRAIFRFNSVAALNKLNNLEEPFDFDEIYNESFIGDQEYVDSGYHDVFLIPMGFEHSFAGNAIMFLTMNLLIFSATGLSLERRNGILKRLGASSIQKWEIITGKIIGRFLLGASFLIVFLLAGKFIFKVSLNKNFLGVIIILQVYALFASCLGLYLGSILSDPEKAVGFCVTLSILLASLGGCWWPIEIVPEWMQELAFFLPTGMAVHALHDLISFGQPLSSILSETLLLLGMCLVFAGLSFNNLKLDTKTT